MKEGAPTDSTVLNLEAGDFEAGLAYLNEHFDVIQSQKETGEVILKAQKAIKTYYEG